MSYFGQVKYKNIRKYGEIDMATSFASLKKSRNSSIDKLVQASQKLNSNQSSNNKDDRFWQPTVDKAGNGMAILRFLPEPSGEELPWVRVFSHGFQGPGGWYIENSLTTLNQKDPVSEYNSKLWNNGTDVGKEQARKQKRRLQYISNVYVVKDSANSENEGKVFLYKYGKKIFDKLNEAMQPAFEDETPVNPFDFYEGANFRLKARNVEGYRNYDKSEFDSPVVESTVFITGLRCTRTVQILCRTGSKTKSSSRIGRQTKSFSRRNG